MLIKAQTMNRLKSVILKADKCTSQMVRYLAKPNAKYSAKVMTAMKSDLNGAEREVKKIYSALRTIVATKSGIRMVARDKKLDDIISNTVSIASRIDVLKRLVASVSSNSSSRKVKAEDNAYEELEVTEDTSESDMPAGISAEDVIKEIQNTVDEIQEDIISDDDNIDDDDVDGAIDEAINELEASKKPARNMKANMRKSSLRNQTRKSMTASNDSGLFDFLGR